MNAESLGNLTKWLVSCPQKRGRIDKHRGDQVCVRQTDAAAYRRRASIVNRTSLSCATRICGKRSNSASVLGRSRKDPSANSADDERMGHNLPLTKMPTHLFVSGTKMINPDRSIREYQSAARLRRGIFFNSGMVPPREANLRALSRSMRALSASRINAVFSATPVNSWAMRTSSSSSARVVLIET